MGGCGGLWRAALWVGVRGWVGDWSEGWGGGRGASRCVPPVHVRSGGLSSAAAFAFAAAFASLGALGLDDRARFGALGRFGLASHDMLWDWGVGGEGFKFWEI